MLSELHAGLHLRYLEERQEKARCEHCGSSRILMHQQESADSMSIEREYLHCYECERETRFALETFEEWAERNDIDLDEL